MPILQAALFLFNSLISLVIFLVIVTAVVSWLVAFDVINLRNPTIYRIVRTLDQLVDPLLRPIRAIMPNLGGIDISPIILLLLLQALRMVVNGYLAPLAYGGGSLSGL
jgi:YggT family protein